MTIRTRYMLGFSATAIGLAALAAGFGLRPQPVGATACAAPTTDNGSVTKTLTVDTAGDYTVWTRMMVPDATNTSFAMQIDGTTCYTVGGTAMTAKAWNWVNYQNGSTSTLVRPTLSAGSHEIKLIGTKPGVAVDRTILVADSGCVPTGNGDNCAVADTTAPSVSVTAPTDGATVSGVTTITANASDDTAVAKVSFRVDGAEVAADTSAPYSYDWNSSTVANGTHVITTIATDGSGNATTSAPVSVTVSNTAPVCSGSPSAPSGTTSTAATDSSISLGWTASTPATGCSLAGYTVYRNGSQIATVSSGTAYTDSGLKPATSYSYTIMATDMAGHASAQSSPVTLKTATDQTAPSAPASLRLYRSPTKSDIWITWNASTDNVGVTGYRIYRNGKLLDTTKSTAYDNTGLSANTSYSYYVVAVDALGNVSPASTTLTTKTASK